MNAEQTRLYQAHLEELTASWGLSMEAAGVDATVLWSGYSERYLFDDQAPPFRANPHLLHWFPHTDCEHGALLLRPGQRPKLYLWQPEDYWHLAPSVPSWSQANFVVSVHDTPEALAKAVAVDCQGVNRLASIGSDASNNSFTDLHASGARANPTSLLHRLDYQRAYKTPFEIQCMRQATQAAVAGHEAAKRAFDAQASEFQINLAYLEASAQGALELPYGNIVGLNEHAGVLHYQHQTHQIPSPYLSLLIDAGARSYGYNSDITRTYSATDGIFADLIAALDVAQRQLIDEIKPGQPYLQLHERMHQQIAQILSDSGIVTVSGEQAYEQKLTQGFFPHGLGHLLGLQTHDVAGHQTDTQGTTQAPPEDHAALRLTRVVAAGQTFTIEPGIYFIPMLLRQLENDGHGASLNAGLIKELVPYGGIRIEDNVVVGASSVENLTRDAFASAQT